MRDVRTLLIAVLSVAFALTPAGPAASAQQAPPVAPAQIPTPTRTGRSEILWDTWGVPHVFATTAAEAGYGYGWAQMHAHANRLLRLYGLARGRGAEYWGEEYLPSDRLLRRMGIPEAGREGYAAQTPEFRRYLDAFAAGVNAYARERPGIVEPDLAQVLPVDGADLVAHTHRFFFTFLAANNQPALLDFEGLPRSAAPSPGSNGWAIGPAHSASGHSLLLANPHLPWDPDLTTHFEAQLVATEAGLDIYGTTLLGLPVPAIAFNDYLGWMHTVNTLDGLVVYQFDFSSRATISPVVQT